MIKLEEVSIRYKSGVVALSPTSIHFDQSQFTVLLGVSGAGKSTLLRSINLLVKPAQGRVYIRGIGDPLTSHKLMRRHRRKTAMIFQQHQLIGRLTALENVLVGRLGFYSSWRSLFPLPKQDKIQALACLERVGIYDKALERVDTLSGGQQQRVGIARGLMQNPSIILADEPIASLDPETSRKILHLLRDISKEDGITTIVSLHQLEFTHAFADRVVALAAGRVVFDGPVDSFSVDISKNIFTSPSTDGIAQIPSAAESSWLVKNALLETQSS